MSYEKKQQRLLDLWNEVEFDDDEPFDNEETDEDDAVGYRSEDSDTVQDANSSSDTDSDNIVPAKRQRTPHFLGKDNSTKWQKDPPNQNVRTRSWNIVTCLPGTKGTKGSAKKAKSPLACWKLFFGDPIVEIVVENTNKYIAANFERYGRDRDCKVTDKAEIEALLGLLYLAGLLKSSRLNVDELWDRRGTGVEMFWLTMSKQRFLFLLRHLRFDDLSTRATRKQTDKLAPIRKLFDEFTIFFKERLIAATKIAERTSRDIVKEADDVRLGAASGFSSPSKKRKRPSPKISIPERETEVIRTIVYNFYVTEKRSPTLKGIYDKIKEYDLMEIEASESGGNLSESMSSSTVASSPLLGPGEILKPSGKFNKPTRIPGKNYCKDEVVIRNADSGKVNPGAKERLVQITGANEESINHAKQLIEDTIRRNASPVREHSMAIGGPLTGSSSSINSSASDESALPHTGRSRTLLHSLSTNDANIGEYKYTVVTGGHTIKITGDDLDLVRISKLVLDEYFSGEPIQDIGQFYSFDSLPQTNEVAHEPLSPPDSIPSPSVVANGQIEEVSETPPLRRPRASIEEIIRGKLSPEPNEKKTTRLVYTIEYLARLAMSPLCLVPPSDLERITNEHPTLIRKLVEMFDAKQYLSNRLGDQMATVLSADEVDAGEV
ncbi:KH domain [Popillia japonica]|uniref:KH domain n=1 Tax=Popillia japonica TaxID=7064 RepID=A0AAW1N2W0_POPJA